MNRSWYDSSELCIKGVLQIGVGPYPSRWDAVCKLFERRRKFISVHKAKRPLQVVCRVALSLPARSLIVAGVSSTRSCALWRR